MPVELLPARTNPLVSIRFSKLAVAFAAELGGQ